MFIEDDQDYKTDEEKNRRLSELLRTVVRDKKIDSIERIESPNKGWMFHLSSQIQFAHNNQLETDLLAAAFRFWRVPQVSHR